MAKRRQPFRALLTAHENIWDQPETRASVRKDFRKVMNCGTETLGAEVFASDTEEHVLFHTCKSRACPSCGYKATIGWQRDRFRDLPEIPYAHVTLTMPDVFWPIFRSNRHLLHNLPAVGADVLQQWARQKYGVRLIILVIPHSFGRYLNFNCHLHILVSRGGRREDGTGWHHYCQFDRQELMEMWRSAVTSLLRQAAAAGVLLTESPRDELAMLLSMQEQRKWIIHIGSFATKRHFLAYAGRYARRPPIAQHRFRKIGRHEIRFVTKDTRTKKIVETICSPVDFLRRLADHVPDYYRHAVRYFGILAPRVKSQGLASVFASLGKERQPKPARLRWAYFMRKSFGVDPLIGRDGKRLTWARRLPPLVRRPRLPGL